MAEGQTKKLFFREYYANVRMFFSGHVEAFAEFTEIQDTAQRIRYLLNHPTVQGEMARFQRAYAQVAPSQPPPDSGPGKMAAGSKSRFLNPRHSQFPQMSPKVALVTIPGKGRGLVAKSKITSGEVLILEEPFVHTLYSQFVADHCFHCFKRLMPASAPLICPRCRMAKFCSQACAALAERTYHWADCRILPELLQDKELGPMAPLVFRTLIKSGLSEVLATAQAVDPQGPTPRYDSQDYAAIYQQVTNAESREVGEIFRRCMTAIYLTHLLGLAGFFGGAREDDSQSPLAAPDDDLVSVGSVLVRHLMSCSCNAYEVSELRRLGESGLQSVELGGAVYANVSLSNHSCYPNTLRYNEGSKCYVRAMMDINKGEEITDNYGYFFQSLPTRERLRQLKQHYHFICECRACRENWPTMADIRGQDIAFKCKHCQRLVAVGQGKKCQSCQKDLQLPKTLKLVAKIRQFAALTAKTMTVDNAEHMRSVYADILKQTSPSIVFPCYDLLLCEQIISHSYTIRGNFYRD